MNDNMGFEVVFVMFMSLTAFFYGFSRGNNRDIPVEVFTSGVSSCEQNGGLQKVRYEHISDNNYTFTCKNGAKFEVGPK
jgi:hypothetical protein